MKQIQRVTMTEIPRVKGVFVNKSKRKQSKNERKGGGGWREEETDEMEQGRKEQRQA